MSGVNTRIGVLLATAGAVALVMVGCASGETQPEPTTEASSESEAPPTSAPEEDSTVAEIDCAAVGEAIAVWFEASFAGMSTEITNAELAEQYATAVDAHAAVPPVADAEDWAVLGVVIQEYADQWSALPPDGAAIENIEAVEERVDEVADDLDLDNDDFTETFPVVGKACSAELDSMFEGS